MTLLPFTLEAWRSGLQPCTCAGDIQEFKEFSVGFAGVIHCAIQAWDLQGQNLNPLLPDLRLRPKTEKRWIQVCRNLSGIERAFLSVHKPPTQCDEIALLEIEVPVP